MALREKSSSSGSSFFSSRASRGMTSPPALLLPLATVDQLPEANSEDFEDSSWPIEFKMQFFDYIPAEEPIDAGEALEIVCKHLHILELFPKHEKVRHREDVTLDGIAGGPFHTSNAVGIAG